MRTKSEIEPDIEATGSDLSGISCGSKHSNIKGAGNAKAYIGIMIWKNFSHRRFSEKAFGKGFYWKAIENTDYCQGQARIFRNRICQAVYGKITSKVKTAYYLAICYIISKQHLGVIYVRRKPSSGCENSSGHP